MRGNRVVEVDGWTTLAGLDELLGELEGSDVVGVLVKGSQGCGWTNPLAHEMLGTIEAAGFLSGWLHYAEPGLDEGGDEAVVLLNETVHVAGVLGVWIELDDLGARAPHELAPWLVELFGTLGRAGGTPVVLCDAALYAQGVALPPGVRLALRGDVVVVSASPWAIGVPLKGARLVQLASAEYELASTRGLVPVGNVSTTPQRSAERPVVAVEDSAPPHADADGSGDAEGSSEDGGESGTDTEPDEPGAS